MTKSTNLSLLLTAFASRGSLGLGFPPKTAVKIPSFVSCPRNDVRRRCCRECTHTRTKGLGAAIGDSSSSSTPTSLKEESFEGVAGIDLDILSRLDQCASGFEARSILESALGIKEPSVLSVRNDVAASKPSSPLFGSVSIPLGVSRRGVTDAELALQTKIRKPTKITDLIDLNGDRDADRASLALLCIMVGSTASAIQANQNLPGPEILRFLVVWLFSFAPLGFLAAGLAIPQSMQATLVQIQRRLLPRYRSRMIQHEAGHFLMGHLLGLPIQGYSVNAVKNAVELYPLNDDQEGFTRRKLLGFDSAPGGKQGRNANRIVQERTVKSKDSPFFSKEGRGAELMATSSLLRNDLNFTAEVPAAYNPKLAWPFRGFDDSTMDKLTVTSVAGVCAEIFAFGNAEGGYADWSQLRQLFKGAESEIDQREMDNRVRYALGYTICQLRLHLGALDALVEVMDRGGNISECVLAIESCKSVSGRDGVSPDYERQRKEQFRAEAGIFERILLGERHGPGEVRRDRGTPLLAISGDDPLYIAIGIAATFLVWAASGGMSLH